MKRLITLTVCLFVISCQVFAQCDSEAHRQFDFWVGEWEVFDARADTLVGHNVVRKILNGCVLEENWTGASGFAGKSFNTFNPLDSTWNQVWVDQGGSTYHFSGRFSEPVMQLYGESTGRDGRPIRFDLAFRFDPQQGTVRQTWRASRDGGATWRVIFDGIYRKKK